MWCFVTATTASETLQNGAGRTELPLIGQRWYALHTYTDESVRRRRGWKRKRKRRKRCNHRDRVASLRLSDAG